MHEDYYRSFFNRNRLVHIVDADLSTCEALSVVFRLEGFQTLFSMDVAGFLASLERRRPDVAIVNLQLGRDDVFALLRRLRAMRSGIGVFALEDRPQVDHAVAAMKAGAVDVLTRPFDTDRLVRGVHVVLREQTRRPAPRAGRVNEGRDYAQLTPRERQVLQLIAEGASNKEAGRELGISPRTIEVHRARVMEKLGARNAADLMRIVLTG